MNIHKAIASIMQTGYAIGKEKKSQQGYKYRGIDDVMNTFQPLMAEAGIFVVPEVLDMTREERKTAKGGNMIYSVLKVKYTFFADDGSSVEAVVIGEGMDSGDKASNKAMAVAMKYAMFQVFCIPTDEMVDPDSETPPPTTPAVAVEEYKCENCGKVLIPYKDSKGKTVSVQKHVAGSKERFGGCFCIDCISETTKRTVIPDIGEDNENS